MITTYQNDAKMAARRTRRRTKKRRRRCERPGGRQSYGSISCPCATGTVSSMVSCKQRQDMAVRRAVEDKLEVVTLDTAAEEVSTSRRDPEESEEPVEALVVQSVEEEPEVAWEDAMDDPTMARTVLRQDLFHLSMKVSKAATPV